VNIEYSKQAVKYLSRLENKSKKRLREAFKKLSFVPLQGDIKQLQKHENLYRLRVGDFRILFSIYFDKNIILINEIDTRGEIYKHL